MVKREPTPPIEDDTKFLIINHPYPLHAAPVIEEERVKLAHWLASCVGQDYLIAIYYKPTVSAPASFDRKERTDCLSPSGS